MSNDGDTPTDYETVRQVLADPSAGREALPELLALLSEGDPRVRLAGAAALCLVATAKPDTVTEITERVSAKSGADTPEATLVLAYLQRRYPDRVDAAETPDGDGALAAGSEAADDAASATDREEVGRVRPPTSQFGPQPVESDPNVIDPADPQRHDDPHEADRSDDRDEDDAPRQSTGTRGHDRRQWDRLFEQLSAILDDSRFDELVLLSGGARGRYADVARVLTIEEGIERALAIRLFHRPSAADTDAFESDLREALAAWERVGDHPAIATVYDWKLTPRPWAATDPVETTVADRAGPLSPKQAVSVAIDVADGLAYAHNQGVLHGSLDPRAVGLTGLEGGSDPATNATVVDVSLLEVYRFRVSPSAFLDPRYAAPEYYDREFGRIDHSTDIYHLGAVLYRLLTGRPPFLGEFEAIRQDVLHATRPQPALQVELPARLDNVVTKAMAKRPLRRYETINDLRQDLVRVHDQLTGIDGDRGRDRP